MKRQLKSIPHFPGIYRIYVYSDKLKKYVEPMSGNKFIAYQELGFIDGKRIRPKRSFKSFAEAKEFKNKVISKKDIVLDCIEIKKSITFLELTQKWRQDILPHKESTTQVRYNSYLKHFLLLNDIEVEKITPSTIDAWITHIKTPEYMQRFHSTRCGYEHEFSILRSILNYYATRFNRNYTTPFIPDHNRMLKVKEKSKIKKDLSVDDFHIFISKMKEQLLGTGHEVIYYIALMQYAIYGRIQDAAALYYEDFDFNRNKIYIRRKIQWARSKNGVDKITNGSKTGQGKEIPMSDFASKIFKEWVFKSGIRNGLLFHYKNKIVTYRQIIHRYDIALKQSGLNFTGTHIIRHASLSEHYDTSKDILATARVAGHSDLRATERYTKVRDERIVETQKLMDSKLRNIL